MGLSSEHPQLDIDVSDSTQVTESLLSVDVFDYLEPNRSHTLLLGIFGEPKVHIWADGGPNIPVLNRVRHCQWWPSQNIWTTLYLEIDSTPATYLHTYDLEIFENYETGYELDGHAIELTTDGQTINLIATTDIVADQNDLVAEDSIGVRWTEWLIDDQQGVLEYIPLSQEYSSLDIHDIGLPSGQQNQNELDPLHGNSIDYSMSSSATYIGSTMRTIDEALIMREELGIRQFFHFGGPLNLFAYLTDSVLSFKAHDFRFVSVSDSTALVTFFSNGDGFSNGGNYAAGKTVKLNFSNLSAELIDQEILPFGFSRAMGSYSSETRTIAPGVWVDTLVNIQSVVSLDYDSLGNEIMRVEHTHPNPKFSYQANRYPSDADTTLLRPTLEINCNQMTNEMQVSASKEGLRDSYQFFSDGSLWNGSMLNDSTIILPWSFTGSLNVMSRYWISEFDFTVDKYSDVYEVAAEYCPNLVGENDVRRQVSSAYLRENLLYVDGANHATVFSIEGKLLIEMSQLPIDMSGLYSAAYIVQTEQGTTKVIIP